MADEPVNFMLKLLQDIRATQNEHTKRFDRQDQRFDELEKMIQDWQETTATGVGFAAHANIRIQNIDQELDAIKERLATLEGRH